MGFLAIWDILFSGKTSKSFDEDVTNVHVDGGHG